MYAIPSTHSREQYYAFIVLLAIILFSRISFQFPSFYYALNGLNGSGEFYELSFEIKHFHVRNNLDTHLF